jgi:hypothetical protein
MITKKELNKMKTNIFEGKYNGDVLKPIIKALSAIDKERREAMIYIWDNNLNNTTPGRSFANADKHFQEALRYYKISKNLLDKLR